MPQSCDIFISYAHVNNQPYSDESEGWIDRFLKDLKVELNQRFGRVDAYKIWKDDELRGNQEITPEILQQLEQAKALLVFYSKGYEESDWCQQELTYFEEKTDVKCENIIFITQDECRPKEKYNDILMYKFWFSAKNKTSHRLQQSATKTNEYQQRIADIAVDLHKVISSSKQEKINLRKPKAPKTTIYLAQVSSDLLGQRERLVRELKQFNYHVIPEQHILTVDNNAQQKIESSACFVQLLEQNDNMGLAVKLYDLAKQSEIPILQWRPNELSIQDINAIEDKAHRQLLLDKTVMTDTLSNFQQKIREHLTPIIKPIKTSQKHTKTIFINVDCALPDYSIAKKIYNKLTHKQHTCLLPIEDQNADANEIRKDLEENLQLCDIVLLIYNKTQLTHIRRLLRECVRINHKREKPLKTAICISNNDKLVAINMSLPHLHELNCDQNFDEDCLQNLLEVIA